MHTNIEIAEFTEAIRLDPTYAEAYYRRGLAYDDMEKVDKAEADFDEAIRLSPDAAGEVPAPKPPLPQRSSGLRVIARGAC